MSSLGTESELDPLDSRSFFGPFSFSPVNPKYAATPAINKNENVLPPRKPSAVFLTLCCMSLKPCRQPFRVPSGHGKAG